MAGNTMLVKAVMKGMYPTRVRNVGDVFELVERKSTRTKDKGRTISTEEQFSKRWMKKVEKGSHDWEKFYGADVDPAENSKNSKKND